MKEASHEGGSTFSDDFGRLDRGVERAVYGQVLRIPQQAALSSAHSLDAISVEPVGL
jgi:hypothetical protein